MIIHKVVQPLKDGALFGVRWSWWGRSRLRTNVAWIHLIFCNTLMHPISVSDCPGPERGVFCILIFDLISSSALVCFSLLRASNYYYIKGPVCCIVPYYSYYSYSELSILFSFIWSQDKLAYVHLLLLYIDIWKCCYFIVFYFKPSRNFALLTSFESVPLWYFRNSIFLLQTKKSTNHQYLIIQKLVQPLKDEAISGVGWLWWGR